MERPPPRSEFMESQTLRLDVVDVSRKMMHRTVPGIVTQRYVIEIFTDKDSYIVRKLYGQMRALSELVRLACNSANQEVRVDMFGTWLFEHPNQEQDRGLQGVREKHQLRAEFCAVLNAQGGDPYACIQLHRE